MGIKKAIINVKNEVYKTVIGDVVVHLNPQNSPFRQICNVLYYHYVLSRMLLALEGNINFPTSPPLFLPEGSIIVS